MARLRGVTDDAMITDGRKAVPLSALSPSAWTTWSGEDETDHRLTSTRAFALVPWLYRAVDIRAKAVQGVPFALYAGEREVTEDPAFALIMRRLRAMLYQTEASLCLKAEAYYEIATNVLGKNLTPYWLAPWRVNPYIDPLHGLTRFDVVGPGGMLSFAPDELLVVWLPGIEETKPGVAPAAVACASAGLLYAVDTFAAGFLERGAIKVTLLTIEGNPKDAEIKKLDSWWKRMVTGVRNAFESVVIRSAIKPVTIGSGLDETAAPELTATSRENVAAAMGVPQSLLRSDPLAGGTVDAERLNFYDFTVLPECSLIEGPVNERYLAPLGLRMQFQPERLEVYQASELRKAEAVSKLVGGAALYTVDEGREVLGRPSMAQRRQQETQRAQPTIAVAASAQHILTVVDTHAQRSADLDAWGRKAIKRLRRGQEAACDFTSEHISPAERASLRALLADATTPEAVTGLITTVKTGLEGLSPAEQRIYTALSAVLDGAGQTALLAILAGSDPSLSGLSAQLRAALEPVLADLVLDQVLTLLAEGDIDPIGASELAQQWARSYTAELITGLTTTTRDLVERAVIAWRATPGQTRADLEALLATAFGEQRAAMIAVTEATRAASQATNHYQRYLAENGIAMERIWRTNADDLVCVGVG